MARFWRRCAGEIAAALALLAVLLVASAAAQDLHDRPILVVDPGMHTSSIWSLAVDHEGRFAITGGADRTVRIWSVADRKLLRTIWIPTGPNPVGNIAAVAISPDGSTIAAGGRTESLSGPTAIYLFDRESGDMIRRIHDGLPSAVTALAFSHDGRYLAATLVGGLRVFDRDKQWGEAFRDDYDGVSLGVAFAPDGRLATTSQDSAGTIRLYDSKFRLFDKPVKAPSGNLPHIIAFSPDGQLLAVGYDDIAAVDVLNGTSLTRAPGPGDTNLDSGPAGLAVVAWSRDGRTLFAAGNPIADGRFVVLAWDQAGRGRERRLTSCGPNLIADIPLDTGIAALPDGSILVASFSPCLKLMTAEGQNIWTVPSPLPYFAGRPDTVKVSEDAKIIDFGFGDAVKIKLRFDVRSLRLSGSAPNDDQTLPPNRMGLAVEGWRAARDPPTLAGKPLPTEHYGLSRSLAIAPDSKRFYLGLSGALAAFDDAGALKWLRWTREEVWAVNASRDGRIVVAAHGDGTIRWRRADDGTELLALQVLPNKKDWVLWTPEGFYAATDGANDVLKWVVNHGPDEAAKTYSVSSIPELHRPDALKLVLNQLETARALGIADIAAARVSVQNATGSLKPPGAVLHVLAIGIDHFGDKAGTLHLDYAADDAREVASTLLNQKSTPDKATLYVDVKPVLLRDQKAGRKAILDAIDDMARTMQAGPVQDVAVILISTHGALIKDDGFYLVPYGFDVATQRAMQITGVSLTEFANAVTAVAEKGKVLLLLDACHSGAVGLGVSATNLDAVLRNLVTRDTVTVLTSSTKDELSMESAAWNHGAFTQAFLDALAGRARADDEGRISMPELAKAMDRDLDALTKGKQHLGPHVNFLSDVFVVNR
jgi:WD40 repeat protein